nr:hypothetical protein [Bacteroidales bacterium]
MKKITPKSVVTYFDNIVDAWLNSPKPSCNENSIDTNINALIAKIMRKNGEEEYLSNKKFNNELISPSVKGPHQRPCNAMPEPFMGDPDKNLVVLFNFNPGFGDQDVKNLCRENIRNLLKNNNYSEFIKSFPYLTHRPVFHPAGKDWWEKRENWLKGTFLPLYDKNKQSKNHPLAIELCPWHSKAKGSVTVQDQYFNKVLQLAEYAFDHSDIKIMIALGSSIRNVLKSKKNSG